MHSLMFLDDIAVQTVQSVFYMLHHPVLCTETSSVKVSTVAAAAEGQHTSGPSAEVKSCGTSTLA